MTGKTMMWVGAVTTAAAAVGLIWYIDREGLNQAASMSGVVGVIPTLAGVALTIYGLVRERRDSAAGQSFSDRQSALPTPAPQTVTDTTAHSINIIRGGHNITRRPSPTSAPLSPAPGTPAPTPPPGAGTFETETPPQGQTVRRVHATGSVNLVDGAEGDVELVLQL